MNKEENVFARWSRRKLQTENQTLQEDAAVDLNAQEPTGEMVRDGLDVTNEKSLKRDEAQPLLTDADMPDIETLHEDSDFSAFMSSGVSDELRNLALRKLFKAPGFNICDGLDEYDEDYTSFEKLGDIITCDMKHQLEVQAEKLRQEQQQALTDDEVEEITETEIAKLDGSVEKNGPVEKHDEQAIQLPDESDNVEDSRHDPATEGTDYEAPKNTGDST